MSCWHGRGKRPFPLRSGFEFLCGFRGQRNDKLGLVCYSLPSPSLCERANGHASGGEIVPGLHQSIIHS